MPADVLKRVRLLSAVLSAEGDGRVTMEAVLNRVLEAGLPVVEHEVFDK